VILVDWPILIGPLVGSDVNFLWIKRKKIADLRKNYFSGCRGGYNLIELLCKKKVPKKLIVSTDTNKG